MSTIEHHLDKLLAAMRERSDAFEAQLAALPSSRPCTRHPGQTAVLLVNPSWDARKPVYGCPACADEVRTARRRRRLDTAGLPTDVRHATLENFDLDRPGVNPKFQTPAQFLAAARRFVAGERRNLILAGTPGIGKGHLAAALAIAALDAGETVAWTDCASLFSHYHRAYDNQRTAAVIERYASPSLTVLDELCLRDLPADGEEILFAIIDRRHKAARRTLLLGNQDSPATRQWLGGRLYDRLKSGGCLFRYGEWESMRGKAKDGSLEDEF